MQAAAMAPAVKKEPMNVYVRLNQNPTVGIDPDAVVLEQPGVIALRDKGRARRGDVTVYIDPVALKATEELSKIELRTADDGVEQQDRRVPRRHSIERHARRRRGLGRRPSTSTPMLGVIDPR